MSAGAVLGVNIRSLRTRAGLSLSELARRSDIAKGTLSQLENGMGNPTIETVFSLSNALNVPVSSLLAETAEPESLVVRSADLDVLSSNAVDLRLLRRMDVTDTVIEVYDQQVRPGETQESAGHPGYEHVVVTQGVLRVGPVDDPFVLGPGDYACFPGHLPHLCETVEGPVASVLILQYPVDAGAGPMACAVSTAARPRA
ncbi:helix-turn-helix domain-containing protein [Herbihabitans rhizosphaerae]|nr:XRE family transcriptional regulator [Herbihabitans rhizosphaerae]